MPNELRAAISAAIATSEAPAPLIADLRSVTGVIDDLHKHVSAGIRERANALELRGDQVVAVIDHRRRAAVDEMFEQHRRSDLALFLDTNRTQEGLRRVPLGSIKREDLERGSASVNHEVGNLVASAVVLSAFAKRFLIAHGYSDSGPSTSNFSCSHPITEPPRNVARDQLKAFIEQYGQNTEGKLWEAAKEAFPDKQVPRQEVRNLIKDLWGAAPIGRPKKRRSEKNRREQFAGINSP